MGVFKEGAERVLEDYDRLPEGWTVDRLAGLHGTVNRILAENEGQIDGNWSVTFAGFCRIIQQEQAQMKFSQDWSHYQRMKTISS